MIEDPKKIDEYFEHVMVKNKLKERLEMVKKKRPEYTENIDFLMKRL